MFVPLRILFVRPVMDFSVSDVSRGYERALAAAGHTVIPYDMGQRFMYHTRGIGDAKREQVDAISKMASETILVEAMYANVDLVMIVSALIIHPNSLWLLRQAKIPVLALHTESPYEDEKQSEWASVYPTMINATHERTTAEKYGWLYLPHAYDPTVHKPLLESGGNGVQDIDVVFVGTGWAERIMLLEKVDWTGIDVRLYGLWPMMTDASPLRRYYVEGCVKNDDSVALYRRAKVAINLHRHGVGATSLNPRAYELAAVGVCTVTDVRAEGAELFGVSQPSFTTANELGAHIRGMLNDAGARQWCADEARRRAKGQTFAARVATLMVEVQRRFAARAA